MFCVFKSRCMTRSAWMWSNASAICVTQSNSCRSLIERASEAVLKGVEVCVSGLNDARDPGRRDACVRREVKSLRIGVHRADGAVVWGPV
eukprot:30843-Pelagococcus_subviridis.AAC.4